MGDPALSSLETAAQQLASHAVRDLPVTVASVALWDQPSFTLRVRAVSASRALDRPLPVGAWVPLSRTHWHRQVFERREPVLVERPIGANGEFDAEAGFSLIGALQSVYLLPIRAGDETVGILSLGEMRSREREPFTDARRERCRELLDRFLAASTEMWEAARLRRQARAMASLLAAVPQLLEARSFEDVLACCASEVAGWLGIPVRGLLLRARPRGGMDIVARWRVDPTRLNFVAPLLMALTRTPRSGHVAVSVTDVADDPLDPFNDTLGSGELLTRVALPLLQEGCLLGVMCLYVEDDLRMADWEVDAFRRRGEMAALGMRVVQLLETQSEERAWMSRATHDLVTTHHRAVVAETLSRTIDLMAAGLPDRLDRIATDLGVRGDGPGVGETMAEEVVAALGELRAPLDGREDLPAHRVDVNALVSRAIEIAGIRIEHGRRRGGVTVAIEFEPAAEPLVAEASPGLIGPLVHAIDGVIDAMPHGGDIHITTGMDDGHVVVGIDTSGSGPEAGRRGAGFPLPSSGEGLGVGSLGLSVLRAAAHRLGGSVAQRAIGLGRSIVEIRLLAAETREERG
jgi:hypothetical protein